MRYRQKIAAALFFGATALLVAQDADSKLEKASEARTFYGVSDELLKADLSKVKVAILAEGLSQQPIRDNQLVGGKYLPPNAEWISTYKEETDAPKRNSTGQRVGQIAWGVSGFAKDGPHFRVYNANGLRSFREAVTDLKEWGAHVVISIVNFPGYGNLDGRGFVNKLVESATDLGIIWIQSVGEFHNRVVNLPAECVQTAGGKFLKRVVKLKSRADKNKFRAALTWNAYSPTKNFKSTDKDLDLVVYEESLGKLVKVVGSEIKQAPNKDDKDNADGNMPFEAVDGELFNEEKPYQVWVKCSGGTFNKETDRVRLTITSEKPPFFDQNEKKEVQALEVLEPDGRNEIMVPADNREVISVGDASVFSSLGLTADGREKPDVVLEEYPAFFTDKGGLAGPHAAAAYLGGIVAVLRANAPGLKAGHIIRIAGNGGVKDDKDKSAKWKTPTFNELRALVPQ